MKNAIVDCAKVYRGVDIERKINLPRGKKKKKKDARDYGIEAYL